MCLKRININLGGIVINNISVEVETGDITKETSDVVVTTVSPDLKLDRGKQS